MEAAVFTSDPARSVRRTLALSGWRQQRPASLAWDVGRSALASARWSGGEARGAVATAQGAVLIFPNWIRTRQNGGGHEAARVHHPPRRHGSGLAAGGEGAAGRARTAGRRAHERGR